ncbi:MAG: hypothetical protein HYX25_01215 [Candidatus Solibacter usitatus]|nr:hypothetical protein [Candidatus Solibacter usitatus]
MQRQEMRKVTVMLPKDLLYRAVKASGQGITPTIRKGLENIAAAEAYEELRGLRGKIKFPANFLRDLRRD